jgi:hypothetical protein
MVPTESLETEFIETLAASTAAGLSVALKVHGVIAPFTPGEDLSSMTAGDLAATTILAGISVTAASRLAVRNPATGDYEIAVQPPAGGFQEVSGGSGTYPVTVYGTVLTQTPHTIPDDIIGSKRFDSPITLTAAGQLFEYGDVSFSFAIGAWF